MRKSPSQITLANGRQALLLDSTGGAHSAKQKSGQIDRTQ